MGGTLSVRGRPKEEINMTEWALDRNPWKIQLLKKEQFVWIFITPAQKVKTSCLKNMPIFFMLFPVLMILGSQDHRVAKKNVWDVV